MTNDFKSHLISLLKSDERLVDQDGDIRGIKIKELANELDPGLIELLLTDDQCKEKFFLQIKDSFVFKDKDFKFYLDANSIDNSFTQYVNTIGLSTGGKFLKNNSEVVLNWPYKDCVLEGGQSTEEGIDTYFTHDEQNGDYIESKSKRKEIFFNEVLAKDEIDRLYEPKAFENIAKYTKDGETDFDSFNRNESGVITDNLLIKGNNLLGLKSLEREFKGQVKLIYIDPPYNTQSDSFKYNDKFFHSTWLTFMKNRLEACRLLMKNDGTIFINIDDKEYSYLKVLCDQVFGRENFLNVFAIKTSDPSGHKTVNPSPYSQTEYILLYAKNKSSYKYETHYVASGYDSGYNQYITNIDEGYKKWKFEGLNDYTAKLKGYKDTRDANKKLGAYVFSSMVAEFALENKESIFQPVAIANDAANEIVKIRDKSKADKGMVYKVDRSDSTIYIKDGRQIYFYSSKVRKIDGKDTPSKPLTNMWTDIPYNGIAKEGGVKLKNGKKPEKLIRRIIEISTTENDIVLDFHMGSGTTGAVAHKLNRQYIGMEQIDHQIELSIDRLLNTIKGDSSGISKLVNWKGGGSFIYMDLAKNNESAKEKILACKNLKKLTTLFDELYGKYFLHYNVRIQEFKSTIIKEDAFKALSLDRQKEIFCRMLDLNQLYVHASEMEDKRYNLSKKDIQLTKDFYQLK